MVDELERVTVYAEGVYEFWAECPFCESSMKIREVVYALPKVGRTLMVARKCSKCGYRHVEVIPLEKKRHIRVYYRAEGLRDLYARIVRSNVASIEIPELGVSISPGAIAPLMITNVEGLLYMVLEAIKSLQVLGEGGSGEALDTVKRLLERGGRFTLILDDPMGLSSIEPPGGVSSGKVIVEVVEGILEE